MHTGGRRAEHHDPAVPHLPAVAERTVQHVPAEPGLDPRHDGQLVPQPGGHEESTSTEAPPVLQDDLEEVVGLPPGRGGHAFHDPAPVALQLPAAQREELRRRPPLVAEEAVDPCGRSVPWLAGVDDEDRLPRPCQGGCPGQASSAPADDEDIQDRRW